MTKKKVALITLYDKICYGTRLLSAIINNCGLESHLIHLKREKHAPLLRRKDQFRTYQFHYNGILRGSFYAVDPVTKNEVALLLDTLTRINPSLIALSTRSFSYDICRSFFPLIKKRFPNTPIISGGWGPTLEPEKFLEFSDYVCIGEGEKAVREICNCIKENKSFENVRNLAYYKGSEIFFNPMNSALKSDELSDMPFPDFSSENKYLISNNRVVSGENFLNFNVYDVFSARGCPLNCTYCLSGKYSIIYKKYSGRACPKYRLRDLDTVIDEIVEAKRRGAKFIRFKDEIFPFHKIWLDGFIEKYPKKIGLPFFAYVRPEFHDKGMIEKLRESGLSVTAVGIQSGSGEIRKKIYKRKLSKQQVINFAHTIKNLNLEYVYHFIYGNPFENERHLDESLSFTYKLPYGRAFFFKLEPFPGSPIKSMIEQENPKGIDANKGDWYTILQCMSLTHPIMRGLTRFIRKNNFCNKFPFVLTLFFIPSLLKEIYTVIENKLIFKAPFYYFRVKK